MTKTCSQPQYRGRLESREAMDVDWNPVTDSRLTIWEITHHLIRRLEQGESGAAVLI